MYTRTHLLASAVLFLLGGTATVQAQGSCCMSKCPMTTMASGSTQPAGASTGTQAPLPMSGSDVQTAPVNAESSSETANDEAKAQELKLEVTSSYSPAVLTVKKDVPVVLKVFRKDANNCGGELLIPEFGVRAQLPAGETTDVKFIPTKAGTFPFTCGMQMMKGQLVVQE